MKIDVKEVIQRPQATVRTDGVKVYEAIDMLLEKKGNHSPTH